MKLARELSKRQTGRTLYLLDEPTTGLHFDDVRKLLEVLHRLADLGNTVIIIEHNLDVIHNADWILDLGPEGGEDGGKVVAEGRPEKVAATPASYTGQFLARYYMSADGHLKPFEFDADPVDSESHQGTGSGADEAGRASESSKSTGSSVASKPGRKKSAVKKSAASPRKKKTGLP